MEEMKSRLAVYTHLAQAAEDVKLGRVQPAQEAFDNIWKVKPLRFDAFVHDIERNQWQVYGVEVYSGGQLVHSFGDTRDTKYPIYSATKSILSIAVGIAWDQGKINLRRRVLDYLPGRFVSEMTQSQRDMYKTVTLHRLLCMSVAGYPFRPEGSSFLRFSLSCPLPTPEKPLFDYSNIPAYLVGVALTEAIQEDAWTFIERQILKPLEIIGAPYDRCPDGYFYGASGMKLSVNELSRVGLLLFHGGAYEGNRIVSEEYVKMATNVQQPTREGGYGYFLWKYRDGFRVSGKWGQKCFILPHEKLIVTYLSHMPEDSDAVFNSMEKHLLER